MKSELFFEVIEVSNSLFSYRLFKELLLSFKKELFSFENVFAFALFTLKKTLFPKLLYSISK